MASPEIAHLVRTLVNDVDSLEQEVDNLQAGTLDIDDDEKLTFGDDSDFSMQYNSSTDDFEFINERTDNVIFRIDATLFQGAELTLENGNIILKRDGAKVIYGAGEDMSSRYDANDDNLTWRDENNSADRMELDRTTGDFSVRGEITEGASL